MCSNPIAYQRQGKGYFMTAPTVQNQEQKEPQKTSDKEFNFRQLEARYEKQFQEERAARLEAERIASEYRSLKSKADEEEEEDSEPYVDHKNLNKKLNKHEQKVKKETQSDIQKAIYQTKEEVKRELWLEQHSDFYDTLNKYADKFAERSPKLARSILALPDSFERQQLVYENIKELGIDRPEVKEPSVQEKIDANKRSPYYQPTSVGSAPYSAQSDFSKSGQKTAYEKMQELKNRVRI